MPTIADIANATSLSMATVSHVLSHRRGYSAGTRQQVMAAAKRLNYRPNLIARQLRKGRSNVIGVMIGADDARVNYDRLAQLELKAFQQGYRLMIGQVHTATATQGTDAYIDDFESRGVAAIIWLEDPPISPAGAQLKGLELVDHLICLDVPMFTGGSCVRIDRADGIRQAVRHLVRKGRRRIGLTLEVLGPGRNPMTDRLHGFQLECRAQGIFEAPQMLWVGEGGGPTPSKLDQIVNMLVIEKHADAILASNDVWAANLLKILRRRGIRVPDDVAVVGFDNLEWTAWTDPELTTIDQRHDVFASAALELIGQSSTGGSHGGTSRRRVVTPMLVIRASA